MTRQREIEFDAEIEQALAAPARGAAQCRPSADAQPRHARRLALPSRSGGGTALRRRRLRCRAHHCRPQRPPRCRLCGFSIDLYDAGDRRGRNPRAGEIPALAGRARLCLRRIRAPARRFRHRRRGRSLARRRRDADRACLAHACRPRAGAAAHARGRAPPRRQKGELRTCFAKRPKCAARPKPTATSMPRPTIAGISPPSCRGARWSWPISRARPFAAAERGSGMSRFDGGAHDRGRGQRARLPARRRRCG